MTRAHLLNAGIDGSRIDRWLLDGRLRRVHKGVYIVGHRPQSAEATYAGAALASGAGARLSHAPCSHLLKLQRGVPPPPEVTVPTTAHRRRPGIVIHRVREIPEGDVSTLLGIPILTVSKLERGFLKLLEAPNLPLPRTNIDHLGDKVDCHWLQLGLTVELLSYRFHATRAAFEQDVARRRRSDHVAYTYGDVFERGGETIADLRVRLAY